MRILLTIQDFSTTGGSERVATNLANALCELGHEVEVMSHYQKNQTFPYSLHPSVKYWLARHYDKFTQAKPRIFMHTRNALARRLVNGYIARRGHYDFIICNDAHYYPYDKQRGTKYLKIMHSGYEFSSLNRRNAFFDTLIVLSARELDAWRTHHKSVRVIPNFLPHIPQHSANPAQKVVLSVGRLSEEKGFSRLLDIWQLLARDEDFKDEFKQWRLIIVGDGVLKPELERKVREFQLSNVRFKPFTKDIESEYLSASIYAMSSHWEGFGMVLAEASACALPCIAFDVKTGPSDIIESEKSGFLVADNDLAGFAKALKILMSDENLRREFGRNAKQIVGEKFSKEVILEKWEILFKELENKP